MIRFNYILIMSLEFREHQQTLNLSQRFYYNNYQYYNDFENLLDYKNDLSKLRFNLSRKSTTTIILYDTLSTNYEQPPEHHIKKVSPKYTPHNQFINTEHQTLEDYCYYFMSTFHQQNYSQMKIERSNIPKQYQVNILYFLHHGLSKDLASSEQQDFNQLIQILKKLKEKGEESQHHVEALFQRQNRIQTPQFMERWFAFQQFFDFILSKRIIAQDKSDNVQIFYFFQFSQYLKWIINQIFLGNYRSLFLMAIPYQPTSSLLLHPLIIPLNLLLSQQQKQKKIVILNLDGKQTYFNLRAVKNLPKSVRYISIFKQPQGSEIKSQKLQKSCSEFEVDSNYDNLNFAHSQLLFRQARPRDVEGALTPPDSNVLLYPLNSIYLRRSFAQMNKGKDREERTLPVLNNSADIRWLWDERISGQVQQWCPELIIVSYNGHLHLNKEDFQAIMKDITIFSDHKVILFPNISGLIKVPQFTVKEEDGDWPTQKIELIHQFMEKYNEYKYENIDEQIFFDNLSSFIKISSGNVSLRNNFKTQNISKYKLGNRLKYLQRLSHLELYSDIIMPPYKETVQLQKLFEQFSQRQKKQNRKQNQYWQKMLDEIQKQLLQRLNKGLEQQNRYDMEVETNSNDLQIQFRLNELALEVEIEFERIFQQQLAVYDKVSQIIKKNKEKIILTNLQHYRYRKSYLSDEQERGGRIRCLRFSLGDQEQICLQRYSQIITDQRKSKIFVINYREGQQNHVILQGELNDRGATTVKLQKVNIRLEQSFQDLNLQNRSEIIRINYSYCFLRQKLYLYWPQQWDLKEEIRRKLLGLDYHPPHVNYMLRVQFHPQQRCYLIDQLKWAGFNNSIPIIPRKSCASIQGTVENRFHIFGGIYDSRLDYYSNENPVNTCTLIEDTFSIIAEPKRKDRVIYKPNNLKPKMNYKIQKNTKNPDQQGASLMITKGYGRSFTNYHSLMSYQSYSLSFQLQGIKTGKIVSKNYRAVRLEKPLTIDNVGRYLIGQHGQTQERFSQGTKDLIIAESRHQKNGEKQILTVVEDQIRIFDFKNNHKRQYLFGWDRTIRQKIYIPHCWSPQLQIVSGGRMHIVCTSLRTQKSGNFNIGNYLIPKEADIVSMCLQEDRLLLLSNSPILNNLDNRPNNYILYQGSLANMGDLLKRKELPLHDRFQFKNSTNSLSLRWKGLFSLDQKIYLLGGLGKSQQNGAFTREDYILQTAKDKLKLKTKKLECLTSSLDLISPIIVKHKQNYLLYALASEQRRISKGDEGQAVVQDFWRIKIQTLSTNDSSPEEILYTQPLQIYHYDKQKKQAVLRRTPLDEPKLIKIIKYTKFSPSLLRQYLQKIYIKINKFQEEKYQPYLQIIAQFLKERDEHVIDQLLIKYHHHSPFFKQLLKDFDFLLDQQKRQKQNIENQELTRDLRALYSLLNKHLLERILLSENADNDYYRFIMEDRASSKVKYIAIGPLSNTKLKFLRVRYKHELSICLNEKKQQELFYNTNVLACEEITQERVRGSSLDLQEEGADHKITINYKS